MFITTNNIVQNVNNFLSTYSIFFTFMVFYSSYLNYYVFILFELNLSMFTEHYTNKTISSLLSKICNLVVKRDGKLKF